MRLRSPGLLLVLALCSGVAFAQTPPAVDQAPVQAPSAGPATPAAPPATPQPAPQAQSAPTPAPAEPQTPAPAQPAPMAPAAPSSPAPAQQAGRTTLFPNPSDPSGVEEGVLVSKPTVVLSGTSTWDEAFTNLKNAFAKIEGELKKAGIAPAGRPLAIFVDTDDNGFKYDAMVPIAQVPEGKTELTPEIKFGKTPEGKSFRFVHKDAYDEIDGTYETITAYLDLKEIVAKDAFIEEYVSDFTDPQDTNFEVNIYVQPKE
ncbi:GyrI-like domain-containing protein [Microvirga sp. 2MCAF35]|uniref:GyrI-like domain-containing protein n=1 Tax=Microvirga sp. 2MCAF35 TaxID=3232987 RepID=UPI003F97792D